MKNVKKVYCNWDLIRFVSEEVLMQEDGTFLTLSVIKDETTELMIFLGKNDSEYEVMVYKANENDKYVPHEFDNVKSYSENEQYATFFFEEYEQAHEFINNLSYIHKEYKIRPTRKIEN